MSSAELTCDTFEEAQKMLAAVAAFAQKNEAQHKLYETPSGSCLLQVHPTNCGELHTLSSLLTNVAQPEVDLVERAVHQIQAGEAPDLHKKRYQQTGLEELAETQQLLTSRVQTLRAGVDGGLGL